MPSTPARKDGGGLDHFQVMRGAACLMVFVNHAGGALSGGLPQASGHWYSPLLVPFGFPWVWLFLILSGYLLTKGFAAGRFSLDGPGIGRFYGNRARRLFPLLWCLQLCWLLLFLAGIWSPHLPAFDWVRERAIAVALPWLPYSPRLHAIGSVDSPVWSTVVEIHFCLLMPLLLALTRMRPGPLLALLAAWAAGMAALAFHRPVVFPLIYGAHLYNIGFFVAGMALALVPAGARAALRAVPWLPVVALAAAGMIAIQYACAAFSVDAVLAVSPLLLGPVLVLLVARADDSRQAPLPKSFTAFWPAQPLSPLRWLERIGMMSYSVYLAHKPIAYILIHFLGLEARVGGLFSYFAALLVLLALVLPLCSLLFLHVEDRFRHRRKAAR